MKHQIHQVPFASSPSQVKLRVVHYPTQQSMPPPGVAEESQDGEEETPETDLSEIRESLLSLLQQTHQQIQALAEHRKSEIKQLQDAAIELAFTLASHVVGTHVDAGEFELKGIVQAAIEELLPADSLTIHLHPEDVSVLSDALADEWNLFRAEVQIQEDASLVRGSCRVGTDQHALISTPEIRFQNAEDSLKQALKHHDAAG